MIRIDGSGFEGGGQIIRGAVALSACTKTPVEIFNIRKNRQKPGLAAQHIAAVKAVAGVCEAGVSGLYQGSEKLTFEPEKIRNTDVFVEVGTAGSIPLVLQAWLPPALLHGGRIRVTGGTEVQMSPTIDYTEKVFFEALSVHGAEIDTDIVKRGYFPEGGGEVVVSVEKSIIKRLRMNGDDTGYCGIVSSSQNLPDHVAERQVKGAMEILGDAMHNPVIEIDRRRGISTGTSCTVWSGFSGGTALGRRGLPSEKVGKMAAERLLSEISEGVSVDAHLTDQLIVILALYGGEFTTSGLSLHAETVCWLAGEFGYEITVTEQENGVIEVSA